MTHHALASQTSSSLSTLAQLVTTDTSVSTESRVPRASTIDGHARFVSHHARRRARPPSTRAIEPHPPSSAGSAQNAKIGNQSAREGEGSDVSKSEGAKAGGWRQGRRHTANGAHAGGTGEGKENRRGVGKQQRDAVPVISNRRPKFDSVWHAHRTSQSPIDVTLHHIGAPIDAAGRKAKAERVSGRHG